MIVIVPEPVRAILERGDFCHVAASAPRGPHLTPMVFASAGGGVWVTTSRGSVKARTWRRDPRVAGAVRLIDRAVMFTGTVTTFDLLDADSWGRSFAHSPLLAVAGLRFTQKNARFFAGYAVDAHHVPLTWTPPGRVFAEIRIERSAILSLGSVASVWGDWGDSAGSVERFRATRAREPSLDRLPEDIRDRIGTTGAGALAIKTSEGPVVLPIRWTIDGGELYGAAPAETVALAGTNRDPRVALQVDRPSWWRARAMVGAMVRGDAQVAVIPKLKSGVSSASRIARAAGVDPSDAAIVRVRPRSLVWWRGWSSGTVRIA